MYYINGGKNENLLKTQNAVFNSNFSDLFELENLINGTKEQFLNKNMCAYNYVI